MSSAADMAEPVPIYRRETSLPDEAATARLAEELAAVASPGDLLLLSGSLGAGKTTLARAFIRTVSEDEALEVPSPTFTLMQSYDTPRFSVDHIDLYRIAAPEEIDELGIDEALGTGVVLIEWPERAAGIFAGDRLEIQLTLDVSTPLARQARLVGHGQWASRLARMDEISRFLDREGFGAWRRRHLQGDASKRRYERIFNSPESAILMDAPRAPDPGTGEVPYSRIAHLAEDVVPFLAVNRVLKGHGLSSPQIHAADIDAGLLVLEDLGIESIVDARMSPLPTRYEAAIDLLVHLHDLELPGEVEVAPGLVHRLSCYDAGALMAEVGLLLDWFAPHLLGARLSGDAEEEFRSIWQALLTPLATRPPEGWVLRDFHSPNLMWLAEREGIARVGLLDFQDAVRGPSAYDVASLVMDARVDMSQALQETLVARYVTGRQADNTDFDAEGFRCDLAVTAAQRNTKILGIFARLARRDGKERYLAHMPRISEYLELALAHPSLLPLKSWYDAYLPAALRAGETTATRRG